MVSSSSFVAQGTVSLTLIARMAAHHLPLVVTAVGVATPLMTYITPMTVFTVSVALMITTHTLSVVL